MRAAPVRFLLALFIASSAAAEPLAPEHVAALDADIRALLSHRPSAGLSVAVGYGDAEWLSAYGYAQLAERKRATPSTTYRLASVTKTLTAVAIMQLVEQGKVKLDDDLHTYLPRYPKKPWPVTVRQLLSHLGGVYHYRDPKKEGHFKTHFSTAQALALFEGWPLAQEPGTKFLYTTYGYDVLGAIVEAASGQSYAEYLREHIFQPAGMSRSSMEDKKHLGTDAARGYRVRAGRVVPSEDIDISSRFAGGGARSSVEDLLRYARALTDGKLVTPQTWQQMQQPAQTKDGHQVDYGLGFGVFPQHGHSVVSHYGGQPETTTLLFLVPARRLVVALATNVEGQDALLGEIAGAVLERLLEDGVRRRPLYADDPVDQALLDGMTRVSSYGLARREGWGGPLNQTPASLDDAFARVFELLSRDRIATDVDTARKQLAAAHHPSNGSVVPRAGEEMARVLEKALPDRNYAALGPIAFFSDYGQVCELESCAHPLPQRLKEDLQWLRTQWEWAGPRFSSYRPERAADARELAEALEPTLKQAAVHPDFVAELSTAAARWRDSGREAEATAALELSARLHPFALEPQLQLADAALLLGDEDRAAELYEPAAHEALLKRAAALELSAHPRAQLAAAWLKKFAGGGGAAQP
ncbi:MAG: beta-lactamase family protein [Archangiaceae bacterium]|nr:beta-lactamase family protein [Archangiaceae bacterium]